MTLEEMRELKKSYGWTNEMVAERSGVPLGTVQKIFAGITSTPRYDTRVALERIFLREMIDQRRWPGEERSEEYRKNVDSDSYALPLPDAGFHVQEGNLAELYGHYYNMTDELMDLRRAREHGAYTTDDYYAVAPGRRVELIDGELIDMAAPTTMHQRMLLLIYNVFNEYIQRSEHDCTPYLAPVDLRLDRDNKTMVQPDLFILCETDAEDKGDYIDGAPDYILEVVSPSSIDNDYHKKLVKYQRAGVREYWIVDPANELVTVYYFEGNPPVRQYSFEDAVPVAITGGGLQVDFAKIKAQMAARRRRN